MILEIVILAAGRGTRMYSSMSKVLHKLAGISMLERVIRTALTLNPKHIYVVIGHESEQIKKELGHYEEIIWVHQEEQLGTGHALMQALPLISPTSQVLILSGDVPLITASTLQTLIASFDPDNGKLLALLVADVENPNGLGRVVRDGALRVHSIVEEKEATNIQKKIHEIYSGICTAYASDLNRFVSQLTCDNAQKEYYLTQIVSLAFEENIDIIAVKAKDINEITGVNDQSQLHHLERTFQERGAHKLMIQGVKIADAKRIDIRGEIICGQDVSLEINCLFEGLNKIGQGSYVGANCVLKNVTLGDNSVIHPNSVLEDCIIGSNCQIGPFARIRAGTYLEEDCKIGNFVEVKNTTLMKNSKASHLTYLGDAHIGENVNIGAGTITCNYDGVHKHKTIIEDGAFIGSGTELVAPVTIGKNATIGAGSTIRRDAPEDALTITLKKQKTLKGWKRAK